MDTLIDRTIKKIGPLDESAMRAAEARQSTLTKPTSALGRLETISVHLAGITGQATPAFPDKVVAVMAADHGVTAEGVSAYPAEVTPGMVANFAAGGAAINVLSRHVGARVVVTDVNALSPAVYVGDRAYLVPLTLTRRSHKGNIAHAG